MGRLGLPKEGLRYHIHRHQLTLAVIICAIIFGLIYWGIDRVSDETNFNGILPEEKNDLGVKMYYSAVTQSTLGYGDITPKTGLSRALASVQVMISVLLAYYVASYKDTKIVHAIDASVDKSLIEMSEGRPIVSNRPEDFI